MSVDVIGWSRGPDGRARDCVAQVEGIRCRIRRSVNGIRWMCDTHGTKPRPHCHHLRALAETPADPEKENR